MAIQYVDSNADAAGTVGATYNIGGSNNKLDITIDGGSLQQFTLTSGATQTAANIVSDLAALTGATASVVTVNSVNYVRIRTTSASGASSTILIGAPANNANATLGFIAGTYHGGTNVNTTFVTSSKANVADNVQDQLTNAGWVLVSGNHSSDILMQSSMSPSTQNLRTRLRIKTTNTNCCSISIENVAATKVGGNGTNNGAMLLPGTGKTWRIIANKYQAFIFVPSTSVAREFAAFGIPYLPSWLAGGTVFEAMWLMGNAINDTDTTVRGSFRTVLGVNDGGSNTANFQVICNNNVWENANASSTGIGIINLVTMWQGVRINSNVASWTRWHDSTAFLTDPLICWGLSSASDEGMARGQLWDSFITTDQLAIDTTLSSIDSHNWWNVTNNNAGSASVARGSLFIVAP